MKSSNHHLRKRDHNKETIVERYERKHNIKETCFNKQVLAKFNVEAELKRINGEEC